MQRDGAAAAAGPPAGRRDGAGSPPRTRKRGPYQPCPCGSGRKFRFCHGDKAPASPFSGVESHDGGDARGAMISANDVLEPGCREALRICVKH